MCLVIADEDLVLMVAGGLAPSRSRQIDQHLATCEGCRSQLAKLEQLQKAATAANVGSCSISLQEKTWQVIQMVQANSSRSTSPRKSVRHLALTTVTAGVVLAGLTYAVRAPDSQHPSSGIAFAQVEAAMGKIYTVTWRETTDKQLSLYPNGLHSSKRAETTTVVWARLQDPALVRLRGSRLRTVTFPSESYQIFSESAGLSYTTGPSGIRAPEVFGSQEGQTPQERLRSSIIFSQASSGEVPGGSKPESRPESGKINRTSWVQRRSLLEGQEVVRFDRTISFTPETSQKNQMMQEDRQIWSFWVEPQTSRIVRREVITRYTGAKGSVETKQTNDRFQYNLTPPKGLFEVTPPIGKRYVFVPLPQRPATAEEQKQIHTTINRAMDACSRKDSAALAAAWDFDYEVATKQQHDSKRRIILRTMPRVLNGKVSLKSVDRAFSRISGVFTRRFNSDPFPPKEPNEFAVSASLQVDGESGKRTETISFNVSRQPDGTFKIIRWYVFLLDPRYRVNT